MYLPIESEIAKLLIKLSTICDHTCLFGLSIGRCRQRIFLLYALVWPVYRQAHAATGGHYLPCAPWNWFAVSSVFLPPSPRAPRRAEFIPRRLADRRAPS